MAPRAPTDAWSSDDPTPDDTAIDRRAFVKGSVAVAAVAAASAAGVAGFALSTPDITGDPLRVPFLGARPVREGVTDVGLAVMPYGVRSDGALVLSADAMAPFVEHPGCVVVSRGTPTDGTRDDLLRFDIVPHWVNRAEARGDDPNDLLWYYKNHGEVVHTRHFADQPYGTGATACWRHEPSTVRDEADRVGFIVLKIDPSEFDQVPDPSLYDPEHELLVVSDLCTHFCCRAGYQMDDLARNFQAWDHIFCACHAGVFDPTDLQRYEFVVNEYGRTRTSRVE